MKLNLFAASEFTVHMPVPNFLQLISRGRASRAAYDLDSVHRWTLTGTPIMNSIDDVYPIMRFLHLRPWYDRQYWWENLGSLEKNDRTLSEPHIWS
jgi:hypothetical protein